MRDASRRATLAPSFLTLYVPHLLPRSFQGRVVLYGLRGDDGMYGVLPAAAGFEETEAQRVFEQISKGDDEEEVVVANILTWWQGCNDVREDSGVGAGGGAFYARMYVGESFV